MSGKPAPRCPACDFSAGHAPDCKWRSSASLSDIEHAYWRAGFVQGGDDPAAGDRSLRKYWAVLASREPCLLNDPSLRPSQPQQPVFGELSASQAGEIAGEIAEAVAASIRDTPDIGEPG